MPPIRNAGDLPGMSFTHGVINYDPRQTEDRGQISSRGLCSDEETFLFSFKVESKSPCVLLLIERGLKRGARRVTSEHSHFVRF